jgi:hypothetical protein
MPKPETIEHARILEQQRITRLLDGFLRPEVAALYDPSDGTLILRRADGHSVTIEAVGDDATYLWIK